MDFKSLLQSMDTLSEGDVVHKGTYGTSHGSEDVRDQYGHKIGKVNKDAAASKPAEKRGRGRPKKGADASGEVKKYDFTAFGAGGKDVKLPKWDKSKTTKHSLKEYIEEVEEIKTTQTIVEGLDSDKRARLDQLIDMFRDSTEPDDYYHREYENPEEVIDMIRQEFGDNIADTVASGADKMHSPRQGHSMDIDPMQLKGSPRVTKLGKINRQDVDAMKRSIKGRLGVDEAEQVTIAPAQQNTQVIKQGNKTLGTVTNPQLAQQIKQSIGKGEMTLMPGQKEMAEDAVEESGLQAYLGNKKYGKDGMEALRKAGQEHASEKEMQNIRAKYSSKEEVAEEGEKWIKGAIKHPGAFTKKAKAHGMSTSAFANKVLSNKADYPAKTEKQASLAKTLSKMHESKQIDESVSLSESPETLKHIISKFKHEVKRFMAGEELDSDLYDALYDYYVSAGEMPYGIQKSRTGEPQQWVSMRFGDDLPGHVDEGQYTTHGMNSGPKSMEPSRIQTPNKPVPNPTPFSVDPINATTDRAINFISGLRKPKQNPFEGKEMKDVQLESWESQLNSLLTEGITVSSSTGQQGSPDTVSVTASDGDADQLLQVLRQAGVGVFGGNEQPTSNYGAPMAAPGEEPAGHGTEPEVSPEVVGDEDDMLALIKKMTGIEGGAEQGSQDYKDEEGSDEPAGTLEPTDSEAGDEESDEEEQTDEGNKFTAGLEDDDVKVGEKIPGTNATKTKDIDETNDGNLANNAKPYDKVTQGDVVAGRLGKDEEGGKKEVEEGHESCNECGYTMEECECDHEKVEESEYANSDDDQHMQDLYYMINTITGGLNGKKRDQTVLNPTQVKVTESDSITDWKKLSGIK